MLLRLLLNLLLFLPLLPFSLLHRLFSRRGPFFAHLRLRRELPMVGRPRRFGVFRPRRRSLLDVFRGLEEVRRRPRALGVLVEVSPVSFGWGVAQELHSMLARLRATGKRVVAFLPQGGGTKEIYVASAADEVYLAPGAPLWATGLRVEATFLAEAFSRLGLEAQIEATGEHKSAGDRLTRRDMSDADREQIGRVLDVTWQRVVADLATRRGKPPEEVRAFFDSAPQSPEDAVSAGIVDGVCHEDEVRRRLDPRKDGPRTVSLEVLARPGWPLLLPLRRPARVAVVPVSGAIVPGGVLPSWAAGASSESVVSALRVAARDPAILGVVIAIDSPGGSATASEAIHHEVIRLREKKPVVAVLGDVAASGGYYVAVAAEKIVLSPLTITGSIGAVGGKIVFGGLLERLGIHREALTRGARAGLLSPTSRWTDEERDAFRSALRRTHADFVARVTEGRKRPREEMEALSGGRVWIGEDAISHGLADVEGDIGVAVDHVRSRTGRRGARARAVALGGPSTVPPPRPLPAAALVLGTERIALFGPLDLRIS